MILEEGRLDGLSGPKGADFKNTVIIMTTNLGTREILIWLTGFQTADHSTHDYGRMKSKCLRSSPALPSGVLNRVDDTIVFPLLTKPEIARIVDLDDQGKLAKRMEAQDMRLHRRTRHASVATGFDPCLVASARAIQREN